MSEFLLSDELPNRPPTDADTGTKDYYRRRIDVLVDHRLKAIEDAIRDLDRRADTIDRRLSWVFGGLAVVTLLANLIGPTVVKYVIGT